MGKLRLVRRRLSSTLPLLKGSRKSGVARGAVARRATTHSDLQLRAYALGIPVKVIHNASIMNAVGACGLQLYRFGEVRAESPV